MPDISDARGPAGSPRHRKKPSFGLTADPERALVQEVGMGWDGMFRFQIMRFFMFFFFFSRVYAPKPTRNMKNLGGKDSYDVLCGRWSFRYSSRIANILKIQNTCGSLSLRWIFRRSTHLLVL